MFKFFVRCTLTLFKWINYSNMYNNFSSSFLNRFIKKFAYIAERLVKQDGRLSQNLNIRKVHAFRGYGFSYVSYTHSGGKHETVQQNGTVWCVISKLWKFTISKAFLLLTFHMIQHHGFGQLECFYSELSRIWFIFRQNKLLKLYSHL